MKNRKKRVTAILTALMTLIFTVLPPPAVSAEKSATQIKTEIDALEEEKAKIDAQISGLQAQIDANMTEIERIVAQKDVIDQQIALLYDKVDNINDQLAAYSTMIGEKQKELEEAQAQLSDLKAKYKERVRAMEENGTLSYWSVVFRSNSLADLLDRLCMIEEIERADRIRLEEIRQAAERVERTKNDLEQKKAVLEDTKAELLTTQEELEGKQKETDELLQELLNKGAEFEKYMEEVEAKASEMGDELDALEGQLDEIERAEYEKWLETQKPENGDGSDTGSNNVNGTTWIVPINYSYFSSPYGMRPHPLEGIWKMHNGVDLSAPSGTPIYAARSGKVYYRGWWGTGGNTIMINHQDGYISRYLHMERFAVSNGEWVAAGQIIGYCGSSGGTTGPHLHFEMQYNGSYVNPAEYINIS